MDTAVQALPQTELSFPAKLAIAYEHYRYVTQAQIQAFNDRLKQQTLERHGVHHSAGYDGRPADAALYERYDVLDFSDWQAYEGKPPGDVVQAVATATERGIFDVLEVAKIKSEVEYHDPIVFGRILGCGDRFFIAQWDHDVKIEDILQAHEG